MDPDGFPMLQIEKVTFSDETTLNIKDDDVILLVGPNNSGKSACLRELRELILHGPHAGGRKVLKSAEIKSPQTQLEIKEWLDQNVKQDKGGTRRLPYLGRLSDANFERDWDQKNSVGLRDIGRFLTLHLTTEERLNAASLLIQLILQMKSKHILYTDYLSMKSSKSKSMHILSQALGIILL